jgi:transposase InsO family protein
MGEFVPLETKELALKLFRQGLRARKISESLGLDRSHVKEWQYLFDGGDTRWVSNEPVQRARFISNTQRAFIVNAYKDDALTMADLCKGFAISKSVVKCWVRDGACPNDRRTEANKGTTKKTQGSRGQEQTLGNLYKCLASRGDGSSKKKILRTFAAGEKAGLSVSLMLKELRVPRTNYYRWLKNPDGKKEPELIRRIKDIQEANNFNIGAKRMAQMLRNEGLAVNHKHVARIMSENGLHAKQKIRKHPKDYYRRKKRQAAELPDNILRRDFTASEPGKRLVTDITYLRTDTGWCFLSAVKDLFNKEIVAYAISRSLNMNLVMDTIGELKLHFPTLENAVIHSDRGWTYTNPQFVSLLKRERMVQSLSAKGDCWDNAPMESFFSTMKSETIHHMVSNQISYAEMVLLVQNYIEYYNQERISKDLNWMSPIQYRKNRS